MLTAFSHAYGQSIVEKTSKYTEIVTTVTFCQYWQ